jgi:hypothetical protein
MNTESFLNPEPWAEQTFGQVQLPDRRRTRLSGKAAGAMVGEASASLPKHQHPWKDLKAWYRLLDESEVTFEALLQPHDQQTQEQMESVPSVLLVQDTTEIDLSHHPKTKGLGQVGNEKGRGMLLQTVLAVVPQTRAVWGCRAPKPFVRLPAPVQEQREQRRHREHRATDVWMELVEHIGPSTASGTLGHVGDRAADLFPFVRACLSTRTHLEVRAAQHRSVPLAEKEIGQLLDQVGNWPSQDQRSCEVPASPGRHGRETRLQISFGELTLVPAWNAPRGSKEALTLWGRRVWEEEAPEGEEALEWIFLTCVETDTLQQAWERVDRYRHRWVLED